MCDIIWSSLVRGTHQHTLIVYLTALAFSSTHSLVLPTPALGQHPCGSRFHMGLQASILADTSSAIESIWTLPVTDEAKTPGRLSKAYVSRESSVSVLWDRQMWDSHKSRNRYWRAISGVPRGTIVRGLAPILAVIAAWASLSYWQRWKFTGAALSYLASPLALMLAFRVNSVVARFHEGRTQWGQMIFNARNIASLLSAAGSDVVDDETKARCCRLLVSFGWAAKAHTRYENDSSEVVSALLGQEEAERVNISRKPALHVLSLLRKTIQPLLLPVAVSMELQRSISELDRLFGGMERLMSTPLSPTYMRHTNRGLLLWLALLPAGLLGAGCTTLPKLLLIVTTTAFIMLGIDEIGIQIEQPFDILPLHAMARVLTEDVHDQLCML